MLKKADKINGFLLLKRSMNINMSNECINNDQILQLFTELSINMSNECINNDQILQIFAEFFLVLLKFKIGKKKKCST